MTNNSEGFDSGFDALPLSVYQDAAQEAARLGGVELMSRLGVARVEKKGPRDLVTEADFASQKVIQEFLLQRFPDHQFVGEEDDARVAAAADSSDGESPFCWIVDPLDGTTNFVHQLPSFSVSIGLAYRGQVIAGAVWDPILEEMFSATRGGGAVCNATPIQVSECRVLAEALFVISLERGVGRHDRQIKQFLNLLESAGSLRRLGSAALNLCYVAMGRVDGYWAKSLSPWDIAAGSLIAQEAGATIGRIDGTPFELHCPEFVCCCSEAIAAEARPHLLATSD